MSNTELEKIIEETQNKLKRIAELCEQRRREEQKKNYPKTEVLAKAWYYGW